MDRIQLVTVDDELYILDTLNDYNIVYEATDTELEVPIGHYDEGDGDGFIISYDEEENEEEYTMLLEQHEEIRKIDFLIVENMVNKLTMGDDMPSSAVVDDENENVDIENEEVENENEEVENENEEDELAHEEVELVNEKLDVVNEKPEKEVAIPSTNTPYDLENPDELGVIDELETIDAHDLIDENQVEVENGDEDGDEDEDEDDELHAFAKGTMSVAQYAKVENIDMTKAITGEVVLNKKTKPHAVVYSTSNPEAKTIIFSELSKAFQGENLSEDASIGLADECLNIVEINSDRLKNSGDPFEKYKYQNPIIYNYLKNFKETDLPQYYKYWLIPIVLDVKKVYDATISDVAGNQMISDFKREQKGESFGGDNDGGQKTSQKTLLNEIEEENKILSGNNQKDTDYGINSAYVKSQYCYRETLVNDKNLKENATYFNNPDRDRQDYTIHVLRFSPIGSEKLEIRKACGSVYKVKNKYENVKIKNTKKPSNPTPSGLDYTLSVDGEKVNTIGFLRLPIKTQSKLSEIKFESLKIYYKIEDIPSVNDNNINDPIAIIFNKDDNLDNMTKLFNKVVPSLDTFIQIYKSKLAKISNLEQVNELLNYYDVSVKDFNDTSYTKLVNILRDRTNEKLKEYLLGKVPLKHEPLKLHLPATMIGNWIEHERIIKNYGKYPDLDTPKDSDLNRLSWITNQVDKGQLFYSVLNSLLINKYYLKLLSPDKLVPLEKINSDAFDQKLEIINKEMTTQSQMIKSLQESFDQEKLKSNVTLVPFKVGGYNPLIFIGSSNQTFEKANNDLSNIYILVNDVYMPQHLYIMHQELENAKLSYIVQELNQVRIKKLSEIKVSTESKITQSITKLQLLQKLYANNRERAQIKTTIKREDLISPDQNIFDLFKHIKNANLSKKTEMYLDMIKLYGILSIDEKWILSKIGGTTICCVHKKDQLLNLPLTKYEDLNSGGKFCKICHEEIGDADFDPSGGYDEDGNLVIAQEGNIIDSYIYDNSKEIEKQGEVSGKIPCSTEYGMNSLKKYACVVIQYIRDNNQLSMNNDQMADVIDLFNTISEITDLDSNIDIDPNNEFIQHKVYNQYTTTERYNKKLNIITKSKKSEQAKKKDINDLNMATNAVAHQSIEFSRIFDRYVLTLISAVIQLELSQPEIYLKAHMIDGLLVQQTLNPYKNIHGTSVTLANITFINPDRPQKKDNTDNIVTINNLTFIDNLSKIIVDINEGKLLNKNSLLSIERSFDFIGNEVNMTPLDYIKKKLIEYYEFLINYPDIKNRYLSKEVQNKLTIKKPASVEPAKPADPETLLIPVESVNEFSFSNPVEYKQLITNIEKRLKYLDQLRIIRINKFTGYVSNLIDTETKLAEKIATQLNNVECPISLRQFYIDYFMKPIYEKKEAKKLKVYNIDGKSIELSAEPAMIIKDYNMSNPSDDMSNQTDEFSQLITFSEGSQLVTTKTEMSELNQEIISLNNHLSILQKNDKRNRSNDPVFKPVNSSMTFATTLYDPLKAQKWKKLAPSSDFISDNHIMKNLFNDKQIQTVYNNSKTGIPQKIEALIGQIDLHLNNVGLGFDHKKYTAILENLGSSKNKLNEILVDMGNMKNKHNHTLRIEIIKYIHQNDYSNQREVVKRDLIRSYIHLTHYLVSAINYEFKFDVNVPLNQEINDDFSNFIDLFPDPDHTIFGGYEYILSNQQIDILVGVFDRTKQLEPSHKNMSPTEIANLLHYTFVDELSKHLSSLYDNQTIYVNKITGITYCKFIVKLLDMIDHLNTINDTTHTEIENIFEVTRLNKYAAFLAREKNMGADGFSIWKEQSKIGFKTANDPSGDNIHGNAEKVKEPAPTKFNEIEQGLGEDMPSGNMQGEDETANGDEFGDDIAYED